MIQQGKHASPKGVGGSSSSGGNGSSSGASPNGSPVGSHSSPLLSAVKPGIWSANGGSMVPKEDVKDEVLFTVNEDDVDMDLE